MTYIRSRLQNDDVEELYSYDDLYTKLCEIIESFCVDLRTTYAKIYNDSKMTRFDFQGLFVASLLSHELNKLWLQHHRFVKTRQVGLFEWMKL